MNFILPEQFAGNMETLRTIFKAKGDSKVTLLAQERVSRAKKMMTPFVLRRRKDQVYPHHWYQEWLIQGCFYRQGFERSTTEDRADRVV
jgi:hypothetical protein